MDGALQSCSLYARAMDAEEVASRWSMRSDQLPEDVSIEAEAPAADLAQLESGPVLRFPGGGRADIDVTTAEREYVVLEWSSAGEVLGRSEVNRASRRHAFALDQLDPRRLYTYRFLIGRGEDARPTAEFELDTHLDLTPSAVPGEPSARARALIAALPENDGMGLVLGLGDGELLIELARAGHAWTAITSDPRQALVVRERLAPSARGQEWSDDYPGERINVLVVDAEGPLRLPPAFAGAVVAHPDQPESARALIERGALASVRPVGGIAALLDDGAPEGDYEAAGSAGPWRLHTRGELPGAADWTHMYGRPDNSAFGGEALAGASSIDELAVQWIGRPGPRYQSDRQNRKPAPLAADGRLFLQGLYRVLALDAYSGTPLWGVELPELSRFNVPRSSANWCTDGDASNVPLL